MPKRKKNTLLLQSMPNELYNLPLDQIYAITSVDPKFGLTKDQVKESFLRYGSNELKKVKRSFVKTILAPVINLLIIIYLISAFALAILGAGVRTIVTFIILGANALVAIIQQMRAEKQLKALKQLSEATARVIRDGIELTIPAREIVMGDIIKITQGDKIPADCRIIDGVNLTVNEASLTGESEPVKKDPSGDGLKALSPPLQEQKNMLFLGTFIASGSAKAIVVKVGENTEIGKISTKLEETNTGDIPLRKKMNHIAVYLGTGVVIILIASIIYKVIIYANLHVLGWEKIRLGLIESIDSGMKVMPINLPLLATIVLLTGVLAMAQKGVIVREISRTESLGRVSILCSDKTGTLTKNEMTVVHIWTPSANYEVTGLGYNNEGGISLAESSAPFASKSDLDLLIISGFLNNNATLRAEQVNTLKKHQKGILWGINGLPTEAALKVLAQKRSPDIEQMCQEYRFIHEFSFDSNIKRMSKIYRNAHSTFLFTKGATEWILPLCSQYQQDTQIRDLDETKRATILQEMQRFAEKGFRILALTYKKLQKAPSKQDLAKENIRDHYEQGLIFLGFVVIYDPPREGVYDAVQSCKSAGITVIMITGDNVITATAIAKQLGIYDSSQNLTKEGRELATLDQEDFLKTTVYARVSPEHKQIIIDKYQQLNKIVAMTGDGVNDALALSMADCGVAMGIQGTDVAKEAADLIITDDSFSTIVTGIREGRGLFMKIRTILYFFICISVMEAIILFSSTLNPANPDFIIWKYAQLNLIYVTAHAFPSLGFAFGNNSTWIMQEKPRDSAEIITWPLMKLIICQILMMGGAIVIVYYTALAGAYPISLFNRAGAIPSDVSMYQAKARTMGFIILFLLETFLMPLQIRRINYSLKDSLKDLKFFPEFLFYLPSVLFLVISIYCVPLQTLIETNMGNFFQFNFIFLDLRDWAICLLACILPTVGFEIIRWIARKKHIVF